jgi:hypothetical protein
MFSHEIRRTWRRRIRLRLRSVLLFAPLACLALGGFTFARAADAKLVPSTSLGPGSQFAVADFDGDRSPDSASIAPGAAVTGTARYSIQLQLSRTGSQSIQLFAPGGGLVIEARDVNGDNNVDLVLATAWLHKPIAVFLNDGHGAFSRAAAGAFPGAFTEPAANLSSSPITAQGALGAPAEPPVLKTSGAGIPPVRAPTEYTSTSSWAFCINPLLLSQPGRAPPSFLASL